MPEKRKKIHIFSVPIDIHNHNRLTYMAISFDPELEKQSVSRL